MRFRREEGNAAIELVMVAPLLLGILAVIVAAGRILSTQSALETVAREAARASSQADSAESAAFIADERAETVASGLNLDSSRLYLVIDTGSFARGSPLVVQARYRAELSDLPGFGFLPGSFELSARHVELIERYKSR